MDAPPIANVECEAALLGAMMQEARVIDPVADRVGAADFMEPLHARIFSAIVGQHSLGKVASPVTLKPFFEHDPAIEEVGGVGYLGMLTGSGAAVIGARDFADQVRELAQRRALVGGFTESIAAAQDCELPLDAVVAQAEDALSRVRDANASKTEFMAAEALKLSLDDLGKPQRGVKCGRIPAYDSLVGPMRPGDLIVGAGRPGMGKSALAVTVSLGVAAAGHGVLFVSAEMKAQQLAERMAADLCFDGGSVPYSAIRDGNLSNDQLRRVLAEKERLASMPLAIVDRSGLRVGDLRRLVRRWQRRFKAQGSRLDLIVVDYLQLIRADGKLSPYEAVSEVSRSLKEIAKDADCAVLALAQLSREVEKRADKRPQLSDLRESGQIEQDADAVLFLLRQEYYLRQADTDDPKVQDALGRCAGKVELILAKRRNGPTGSLVADFHAQFQAVR